MFEKKVLFKKHSTGQVGSWVIFVEPALTELEYPKIVVQACKVVGGKPVETVTEIKEGKNIGKANETTPLEQACNEAQSKVNKQYDKGYVDTLEQAQSESVATNALGLLKPMLAQPIEKVKQWSFPVHAQPKMDGHRMLATVQDGEVILYSRQGKVQNVPHIREQLQALYELDQWDGTTLDGEAYIHGIPLQIIGSFVKKYDQDYATSKEDRRIIEHLHKAKLIPSKKTPVEEWSEEANTKADMYFEIYSNYAPKDLVFNTYDMMTEQGNYVYRLASLILTICDVDESGAGTSITGFKCDHVTLTETKLIENEEELNKLHSHYLSLGYEGTIVRQGDASYESDKRSQSLMKKKDYQDAEFIIVGHTLGKPNIRGDKQYQVPIFILDAGDGRTFEATAMGSMLEKHGLYLEGLDKFIGKPLTVKFFELTPDGIPFQPVALRFREDV